MLDSGFLSNLFSSRARAIGATVGEVLPATRKLLQPFALALPSALALLVACSPVPHGTIGAILGQQHDGRLFIRETPEGLAAAKAGLEPGDEIMFIEGIEARTLTPEQISELLGGPVGVPVQLTVLRGEEVLRVTLKRTEAEAYTPREASQK